METLQKIMQAGFCDRLKLDTAYYDDLKDECVLNFIYNEKTPISEEEKAKIKTIIEQDVGDTCAVVVKFNKSCFDADVIRQRINEYFNEKNKALSMVFEPNDIQILAKGDGAELLFNCDLITKQVLENKGFIAELLEYLSHKFFIEFDAKILEKQTDIDYNSLMDNSSKCDTSLSECLAQEEKLNRYEVEIGDWFYGKYTGGEPVFINAMPRNNGDAVLLAGRVINPNFTTFMKKSKQADVEPVERKKFTFTLEDLSGKIDIVIFPNDNTAKDLEVIVEGMQLCVAGTVNIFNERLNIKANGLALCEIKTNEIKRIYRKVNDKYFYVFPKPVNEVQQMDLFSLTEKKTDYWDTHKEVVVFDFETTGLDANSCQIIEIGAVKVVNGSITETFQTLINPQTPIPQEITAITHIDDSMVVGAPTIDQVLPDFYRFTYGAVLSAYNIDFDYQFLNLGGKKLRLLFDNEQIDTLKLARDKVPSLSNYKLGTVVKALNITLENAHRALADAYATAKVFIKLV